MHRLVADGFVGSSQSQGYVTFSVDDGHPTDLRTAQMLSRLGLQATFYVPARNQERKVLTPRQVRGLAQEFEIGAHTMNHKRVHRLSTVEAYAEIADGKKWLEDVLSKRVISFCYPGGKHNPRIREIVASLDFMGARTCQLNLHSIPEDPLRWGVSTQAYSHGLLHSLRHNTLIGAINHVRVSRLAFDWESHFLATLDWVESHGGIAHLYIHSWETDRLGEWQKLERVLASAASHKRLMPVTNGRLFSLWHEWRRPAPQYVPDPSFR